MTAYGSDLMRPIYSDYRSTDDYRRLLRPSLESFSVFGLRGSGKTVWARTVFPDAHVVDLTNERDCHRLLADPPLLISELRDVPRHVAVVVDGINRAVPLVAEIARAMETTKRRFVVLGSSVCPLRSAGPLLARHAPPLTLFPLVPAELGPDFSLDRVLRYGSLPSVWESADPRGALDEYVREFVRDEIRGDAVVRNLPAFLRFLPVAARAHGRVVNVAALARDAGTSRTTVDSYLGVLRDTLMASLLPAFEPRLRVRERRHPKLYWTDAGVVRASKDQLGDVSVEERGALLEGFALTVLRAHNHHGEIFDDVGYWSPGQARSTEVHFLLRRGRDYLALSIESATRHAALPMAGMRAIASLPRLVRRILVFQGSETVRTADGIDIWPMADWLDAVAGGRLWP